MKIKCARCKRLTNLETRLQNIKEQRSRLMSWGTRFSQVRWLDEQTVVLADEKTHLESTLCECREASQLPLSNTGVKISAFSEGIAQKAAKTS